jgi:hypothetical protein
MIDNPLYKKLVPITRVVNAALIDDYGDNTKSREQYMHWAARGVKGLQSQVLKLGKRRVMLDVNKSFQSATLPPDFAQENLQFVGYIDHEGYRVALGNDQKLTNEKSIENIECEDACPKCNQDKGICNDLDVTESEEQVIVNGGNYTKTTIKKLYPDGRYYIEVTTPYYNTVTSAVEYATTKQFITELDLKVCGCVEDSESNMSKIKQHACNVYDCYYSPYSDCCDTDMGGYKIFPEIGVIQLDYKYKFDKVYIEYIGCMPKINGQYGVPEVAFETLVSWVKFKAVENKKNLSLSERQWVFSNYMRERGNMEKIMGRVSLSSLIKILNEAPKFEVEIDYGWGTYGNNTPYHGVTQITSSKVSESVCEAAQATCGTGNGTKNITPFQLAVIAGNGSGTPVAGQFTYTNGGLKDAVNVNTISVNKAEETTLSGDFTFDATTGTITRTNPWFAGDTLIIGFAKLV